MTSREIQEKLNILESYCPQDTLWSRLQEINQIFANNQIDSHNVGTLGQLLGHLFKKKAISTKEKQLLKQLLKNLAAKIPAIEVFTAQEIGNALYGLLNWKDDADTQVLINALFNLQVNLQAKNTVATEDILPLVQAYMFYSREMPDCLSEVYKQFANQPHSTASSIEHNVNRYIKESHKDIKSYFNHYKQGFEMDVYLPDYKLNIELDSQRYHEAKRKKLFTERRDKYLQTLGISIKRIKFGKSRDNPQWKAEINEKIIAVSKNNRV